MRWFRRRRPPLPPTWEARSRIAIDRVRQQLTQQWPGLVEHVFSYGMVDLLDPSHLVVWIELAGPPDQLPEWWFPAGDRSYGRPGELVSGETMQAMRHVVEARLGDVGWPDPASVQVGFESARRAQEGGGWQYYR